MKRSDPIAPNKTELRRLIRSGVLAGAVLILLVSLPDFVPPLAHLMRPSRACIPGAECFGEAIKAIVWQFRWPCAALGAVTIIFGGLLALATRSWREHSSTERRVLTSPRFAAVASYSTDTDSPATGMSAKEIAALLPGIWTTDASGCAYPHPQRRVRIAIETNCNLEALQYERRDPYVDCDEFARDLLTIIGDDLCARDQLALIRALAARLTAWQAKRGRDDDPVRECFEEIMHRHVEYFPE